MGNETAIRHSARIIWALSRFVNGLGACILVAMMLLVVIDVSMRFLFNRPVEGSANDSNQCLRLAHE